MNHQPLISPRKIFGFFVIQNGGDKKATSVFQWSTLGASGAPLLRARAELKAFQAQM
jgi:hypothetical protein